MITKHALLLALSGLLTGAINAQSVIVPLAGNTWVNQTKGGDLTDDGASAWTDPATTFTTYIRVSHPGTVHVWVKASVPQGNSTFSLTLERSGVTHTIQASDTVTRDYDGGEWAISDSGYMAFTLKGQTHSGSEFARVKALVLGGSVVESSMAYVPNNDGNFFYWGRRGPSVHLGYDVPKDMQVEWFYNEVTVPVGQDKLGSYFMADGFGQGYFGMQVNSPTERHILFSVWSPFQTDDPKSIPDSMRILLVRKGDNVHAGSFGSEGSGGQSYMNYIWKAGNTYRFLLRAIPEEHGYTAFTAWFFAPEVGHWQLIAGFRRPQTQSWLNGLHSFLENFEPEQGDKSRYVLFNHQWVADAQGHWKPVTRARFTGDNTARKGYRLDYAGGITDGAFFLKNGGFFAQRVALNTWFERPASSQGAPPDIDLSKLP